MTGRQKLTVLVVLGGLALLLGGWEAYTLLSPAAPDDHITESFRALARTDLGILILIGVSFILGTIAGHVFHRWGRVPVLLALVLFLPSCAYLKAPRLSCKPCWTPAPCEHPWIPVDESGGGGCMLIVPEGQECPTKEE